MADLGPEAVGVVGDDVAAAFEAVTGQAEPAGRQGLAMVDCEFVVESPEELVRCVRELGGRLSRAAGA